MCDTSSSGPLVHLLLLDQTNIECMFVSVDDTMGETSTPSGTVVMRMVRITNDRISAWLDRLALNTRTMHSRGRGSGIPETSAHQPTYLSVICPRNVPRGPLSGAGLLWE